MAQVFNRRGRIQLRLDLHEREALLAVVEQLTPLVGTALATTPRAYEDDEHQAEFDRWVRPDVERSRDADLVSMREALASGEDTIILTEPHAYEWLRAINHLRLAAGAALGIDSPDWDARASIERRDSVELRMLTLLSWLQEEFVAALEA